VVHEEVAAILESESLVQGVLKVVANEQVETDLVPLHLQR